MMRLITVLHIFVIVVVVVLIFIVIYFGLLTLVDSQAVILVSFGGNC